MGNLGSVHNVAAAANFDVTADNEYQRNYQQSTFAHNQHQEQENPSNALHWLPPSSYSLINSGPQSQSHIKVLPKIPKSSRLRVTNNGTILQSGGTISSRRNQLLTSSQSSKHINHHHDVLHSFRASTAKNAEMPQFLQRRFSSGTAVVFAGTNDNMDTSESFNRSSYVFMEPTSYNHDFVDNEISNQIPIVNKHYGSEPDLRCSVDNETNSRNAWKSPSPSKTKLVKKKKKNPAPTPPPAVNHHSGKDQESLHMMPGGVQPNRIELRKPGGGGGLLNEPQRKHRLFKTKAESRKCDWKPGNTAKPTFEASDFRQLPSPDRTSRNLPSSSRLPPVFRREKSFDIILLRNNKLKEQIATDSNPIISKTPPLQRKRSVEENNYQQNARHKTNVDLIMMADTKPNHNRSRKFSQPETALLAKRNFKKELEEATMRRSMVISTTRDEIIPRNSESKNPNYSTNKENFSSVPPKKTVETAANKKEQLKSKDENNFNDAEIATKLPSASRIPQLQMTKTFYFGMGGNKSTTEQSNEVTQKVLGKVQMDVIDQFAKSIFAAQEYGEYQESLGSSESALSSEEGDTSYYQIGKTTENHIKKTDVGSLCDDEDDYKSGSHQIQVLVRPTLPRRQLEIPRFSPAAAWRMLNDDSQQQVLLIPSNNGITPQTDNNEPPTLPLEERIQMVYRGPPVPMYADNKSGDSGISGDAGLPDCTDGPRNPVLSEVKIEPFLTQWTPQQDLDDDDDDDYNDDGGGRGDEDGKEDRASSEDGCDKRINKYPSRGHLFSLSLPRETHLSLYEDKNKPGFSSLQKLKRTVSGVFSNQVSRDTIAINYRSDNWLLSRSAPNSIDSSQLSPAPGCRGTNKLNNSSVIPSASFGYLKAGNHVMYLPNTPAEEAIDCSKSPSGHIPIQAKYNDKIIENVKTQNEFDKNTEKFENLEGPVSSNSPQKIDDKVETISPVKKSRTGHRFTFQSTVRQIERRRIADKLSKEAERNEAQRLSELEVMRKVEEEFQRKRAREKASIRHQLRLFSLEENQCVSLPVDIPLNANGDFNIVLENVNTTTQYQRADPDGATSSPESSPILSNYSKSQLNNNKTPDVSHDFLKSGLEFVEKLSQAQHLPLQNVESLLNHHRIPCREYFEYRSSDNYDKKKYKSLRQQLRQPEDICKIPQVD